MKLRLKANSARLRLTQGEVAQLAKTGQVKEAIEFGLEPHQRFVYAIETDAERDEIRAEFENNRITVFIAKKQADEWTQSEQIGLETEQKIGGGKSLKILIEKDFACLTPRAGEDESDAFAHPAGKKIC